MTWISFIYLLHLRGSHTRPIITNGAQPMITKEDKEAILKLSVESRLELLEFISESLADQPPQLSEAQRRLLDERLAEHKANPTEGEDWRIVVDRLRREGK